ncbi:MAG: TlpA disulfide reductase family protein [Kiloniellales bacterium]
MPAPQQAFTDLSGRPLRLADYRGKLVLINVWATWCLPCVQEMPSLDRLQADLGDQGLVVLALSIDRGGANVVAPFLARHDLRNLAIGLDPKSTVFRALGGARAVPSSYLIDPEGRIVGEMEGAAEWDGPDAKALIEHYLMPPAPEFLKTDG